MPSLEFAIAASGDDAHVTKSGATYPPAGTATVDTTAFGVNVIRGLLSSTYYVDVGLLRWNTASIPDEATFVSGELRFRLRGTANTNTLSLVGEYYTWTTAAAGDHTNTPPASPILSRALSTFTGGTSTDYSIPITNLSGINKTGYTGIRLHITQRTSDAAPTGSNSAVLSAFDVAGTLPKLYVEYTLGGDLVGAVGA